MELIFKGLPEDIERFFNEILYPVIRQRQEETEGHYFRITEDKGDYYSRDPKAGNKVRRIKGYFPARYYPVDFYKGKYDPGKTYTVNEDGLIAEADLMALFDRSIGILAELETEYAVDEAA